MGEIEKITTRVGNIISSYLNTATGNIIINFGPSEDDYTTMASGGYTGVWGKSGRLAVLHEKELV
jgi:hypothetical protein